jgi:hypothetical protein
MKFTPKTTAELDAEAASRGPFANGVYDFEFVEANDAVSQKGNDMIAIVLNVYNQQGETRKVKDWLLESVAYKLKHACETCGLGDAYAAGSVDAFDFLNRTGRVKLRIEKSQGYPDKNVVVDYVVDETSRAASTPARQAPNRKPVTLNDLDSDDIPF